MKKRFQLLLLLSVIMPVLQGCGSREAKNNTAMNDPEKMPVSKENWGKVDNKDVFLYTLKNKNGIVVKITNYGGIITSIFVPDAKGKFGDIVLGYDSLKGYLAATPYFGAIVGRYANRIAKGTFKLENKVYKLAINNGNNTLHGGLKGFDKVVWDARPFSDSSGGGLVLTYRSPDGEEGYPGNLDVKVTYLLNSSDELKTTIEAASDKPTPVNLCNHTYFNLQEANTSILGHRLRINADRYTVVNDELIPTGELRTVNGSPMDFREFYDIGLRIGQVKGGYDHNYMLIRKEGELTLAAVIEDPLSGRDVTIFTTQPGVQFYSGNFLDGTITGKGGKVYKQHFGMCLETQHFPDSPNQPSFPNTILRPGEKFKEVTVYKFGIVKNGKE
ncbi:MAG: galactose mutarotase [Bacteroidetes bacterium]|nr:galactose mutarotase [Bacteroidota bacterium]